MGPVTEHEQIDVDRAGLQTRVGDPPDGQFDLTNDAFELGTIEVGVDLRSDVQKGGTARAVGRLALVERRDAPMRA